MESLPRDTAELFDEVTLGEMTERAAAAQNAVSGVLMSEADLDAVQVRAREIVAEAREAQRAAGAAAAPLTGIGDMHALSLSIGLPVPREILAGAVISSSATRGRKRAWLRELKAMTPITETGCIQADFYDTVTRAQNTAFLVLEKCGEDHDLGAQLGKVFGRIAADKHDEIRKHLSMLVFLGRSAYDKMAEKAIPLLVKVGKKMPDGFNPLRLVVDPQNTTLYIPGGGPHRVGIFVRLANEVSGDPSPSPNEEDPGEEDPGEEDLAKEDPDEEDSDEEDSDEDDSDEDDAEEDGSDEDVAEGDDAEEDDSGEDAPDDDGPSGDDSVEDGPGGDDSVEDDPGE